jgi:hypothetical protein
MCLTGDEQEKIRRKNYVEERNTTDNYANKKFPVF